MKKLILILSLALISSAQADIVGFYVKKIDAVTYEFWTTRVFSSTDSANFYLFDDTHYGLIKQVNAGTHRAVPWGPYDLGATVDDGTSNGGGGDDGKLHGPMGGRSGGYYMNFVNTTKMKTRKYWVQSQFIIGNQYYRGDDNKGYTYSSDSTELSKGAVITPGTGILTPFHFMLSAYAQ